MKIKAIVFTLVLSLLAIVGIATASPNFQNTPYAANNFSATFDGTVNVNAPKINPTNQEYVYWSFDGSVTQAVTVRFIDHDIAVTQESADFYANENNLDGEVTNTSTGVYQGHVFTYTRVGYLDNGVKKSKRERFIIVNAREVIFITQIAPYTDYSLLPNGGPGMGDQPQWFEFEDSLNIR